MIFMLLAGVLVTGVGLFMTRGLEGATVHTNGLAVMWVGAMLILRYMIGRNAPAALLLWAVGGASLYYVFGYTDLPHTLTDGGGQWIVGNLLLVLAAAVYLRSRKKPPPPQE
ncbi:hypothetical protein G5C60_00930 [Streptomyces sp. HC44]|uniref:Uncharacterized protein n=1 Tax=Streptomyces scabichelini TaxID=2711217 RepID=A0A6G4UXC1_9ACTN|nr:hypothetical protein [Streptomyces scabichelini]NGO06283.1 hypothetical protein [Streptomyces scabichelini]